MRIARLQRIEESATRNIETVGRGKAGINLRLNLEKSDGKPWPQEISYRLDVKIGEENPKPLFTVTGRYAIAFQDDSGTAVDKSMPGPAEAYALAWPLLRGDAVLALQRYSLGFIELPYSVNGVGVTQDDAREQQTKEDSKND